MRVHSFARWLKLFAPFLVLCLIAGLTDVVMPSVASAATTNVSPAIIPVSDSEIVNPGRGLYQWRGANDVPVATDEAYQRYNLDDLITTVRVDGGGNPLLDGSGNLTYNYDVSSIINDWKTAISGGKRFSFRIRSMPGPNNGTDNNWLPANWSVGNYCANQDHGTWIPKWSDNCFKAPVDGLFAYLKAQIATQLTTNHIDLMAHLDYIDIGLYGQWGEFYLGWASAGNQASVSDQEWMINEHTQYFPTAQLLMNIKRDITVETYAFGLTSPTVSRPIGIRSDCAGQPDYFGAWARSAEFAVDGNRWQTAPFVTEWCPNTISYSDLVPEIQTYHLSQVSNGNFGTTYAAMTPTEQGDALAAGKAAGYRYQITNASWPSSVTAGISVSISNTWQNAGVGPAYDPWSIKVQLRNTSNAVSATATSTMDLSSIKSSASSTSTSATSVTVPSTLAAGTYSVVVDVVDPNGILPAMQLANAGKQTDGSYVLGSITVTAATAGTTPPGTTPPGTTPPGTTPPGTTPPGTTPPTTPVTTPPVTNVKEYRSVSSNGTVTSSTGNATFGDASKLALAKPIVGMDSTPSNNGYWLVASDGGIFSYGDAGFYGSTGAIKLNQPIVGMSSTPSGNGYWLVASDGGIFAYGDASFFGSTGSIKLNKPIVGMTATPSGHGYWLVASDGGIFAYGDAGFYGSTGSIKLNKPIVGMSSTPSGLGYWLVASDGGIFAYGDAGFYGSSGAIKLNQPIVGMTSTPTGRGYWLVASDGGVFSYGDAPFLGTGPAGAVTISG